MRVGAFIPAQNGSSGGGGGGGGSGSIVIERIGDAGSVNLSTLGTIDWFAANTTATIYRALTANRFGKAGAGGILLTFNGTTRGQATSTTLMSSSTITSSATDSIEGTAVNTTGSWGVSTPNATVGYGIGFQVPSGGSIERVLRIYCANTLSVARLTCTLDDGTEETLDLDNPSTIQTHEIGITYSGASVLSVKLLQVSHYAGTSQLAFQAASLGLV